MDRGAIVSAHGFGLPTNVRNPFGVGGSRKIADGFCVRLRRSPQLDQPIIHRPKIAGAGVGRKTDRAKVHHGPFRRAEPHAWTASFWS